MSKRTKLKGGANHHSDSPLKELSNQIGWSTTDWYNFCQRFSRFHPDRVQASEIPLFAGSVGEVMVNLAERQTSTQPDHQSGQHKSKKASSALGHSSSSVPTTQANSVYEAMPLPAETKQQEHERLYTESFIYSLVIGGVLYLSNCVLDQP